MSIKSDKWIKKMAKNHGMIEPFQEDQIKSNDNGRIVSYGTSSYGYDVRCADEFKVFTNINSSMVDPKNFDDQSFVDIKSDVCTIPPNSFALARTVEYFRIPRQVLTLCLGKSTYARCGITFVNTYRLISPSAPFGGIKDSGYGKEAGIDSIKDYTRVKTTWFYTSDEPSLDPFSIR